MALVTGARLGPYEITGVLGAGGMGEVYRAHDSALGRDVAIKVLPEAVAADRDRVARFAREARMLASLNHPNIGTIHGWESSSGVQALVLELVDGPTLRDRIASGPLPLDQALGIARQIADALEAAHNQGIVHRDLKPANIKVRPDGRVKVLDFGLAKALAADDATGDAATTAAATQSGIAIGTPAYMSPEQARGEPVTRQTDIWSFGVVLFEMVSGRHPFGGGSPTAVMAAILHATPEWEALPAGTPPAVTRLLRRCLEKDPRSRIHDISDARLEIDDALAARTSSPSGSHASAGAGAPRGWSLATRIATAAGALAIIGGAVAAAYVAGGRRATAPPAVLRLSIVAPPGTRFQNVPAVSPDGAMVAFVAASQGATRQIWIRTLASQVPRVLAGTDGAAFPFWSPDSRSLAFFADGKLKRIDVGGDNQPIVICDAKVGRGGAWIDDGTIVFAPDAFSALVRVSVASGQVAPFTTLDPAQGDTGHRFPAWISGRYLLYSAAAAKSGAARLISLDAPDRIIHTYPIQGSVGYANGFLLFGKDGQLVAERMRLPDGELSGEIVQMGGVRTSETSGRSIWSSSPDVLVLPGPFDSPVGQFTWLGQDGRILGALGQPAPYQGVELSPDGRRIATLRQPTSSLQVLDTVRGVSSSVTKTPTLHPVWSVDGSRLAYMSTQGIPPAPGRVTITSAAWAGGGTDEQLRNGGLLWSNPVGWTRDGTFVWVEQGNMGAEWNIWQMLSGKPASAAPFVQGAGINAEARLSRDGKWIAYASDQSGDFDIIVQRFPARGPRYTASSHGGRFPRWSADGRALFYLTRDFSELMAVSVTGDPPVFGAPLEKFKVRLMPIPVDSVVFSSYEYDVDDRNSRFIVNQLISEPAQTLNLVVNWMPR